MNDMPVAYQSRAVTEPQREAVSRRLTEGLTVKDNNFFSPVGVAESPQGDRLYACPARGYFSVKKSNQKSLGEDPETPYASVHPARKHFVFPERD